MRSLVQKRVEQSGGNSGGIGYIENISADQQHIDLFIAKRVDQPVQKLLVLPGAVVLMKQLAYMPVGRMEYLHRP